MVQVNGRALVRTALVAGWAVCGFSGLAGADDSGIGSVGRSERFRKPEPRHEQPAGRGADAAEARTTDPARDPKRPEDRLPRNRFELYLAPMVGFNSLSGDLFDGRHVLVGSGETLTLPKMDAGAGFGAALGFRMGLRSVPVDWAFQLGILGSRHSSTFGGSPARESYLSSFNVDLKLFFRSGQRLQPWVLIGRTGTAVTLENGSSRGGDATFIANGWNLGTGLSYYLHRNVSVDTGLVHRWLIFDQAEGRTGTSDIRNPFWANSFSGQVSLTLHWGLKKI